MYAAAMGASVIPFFSDRRLTNDVGIMNHGFPQWILLEMQYHIQWMIESCLTSPEEDDSDSRGWESSLPLDTVRFTYS